MFLLCPGGSAVEVGCRRRERKVFNTRTGCRITWLEYSITLAYLAAKFCWLTMPIQGVFMTFCSEKHVLLRTLILTLCQALAPNHPPTIPGPSILGTRSRHPMYSPDQEYGWLACGASRDTRSRCTRHLREMPSYSQKVRCCRVLST